MPLSCRLLNAVLLVIVTLAALSVVTAQHQARKSFIALQQEKQRAQQMEVEWGQLQLEQSTWAAPAQIEKISGQHLDMQRPKSTQVRYIRVEQNSNDPPLLNAK